MAQISKSELLHALAVVDEKRQTNKCIDDDVISLQQQIAEHIKAYYAAHNITVDAAIIDAGVTEYLNKRFSCVTKKLSPVQSILASIIMSGKVNYILASLGSLVLIICFSVAFNPYHEYSTRQMQAVWTKTIADYSEQVPADMCSQFVYAQAPCTNSLAVALGILSEFKANVQAYDTSSHADRSRFFAAKRQTALHIRELENAVRNLHELSRGEKLLAGFSSPAHTVLRDTYPHFAKAYADTVAALKSATNIPVALSALESAAHSVTQAEENREKIAMMSSQLMQLRLKPREKEEIRAYIDFLLAKNRELLEITPSDLTYYQRLADTHLFLRIVDRSDVVSGVRRTAGENSHSYYLIVEAVDTAGTVFPLRVYDHERDIFVFANMFGIRVSLEQYEKVKQDKRADGIIDIPQIGEKKVGAIAFTHSIRVLGHVITGW